MTTSNPAGPAMTLTTPTDLEVVVTREFDAPAALIFEAWTVPEHIARWMGPREMETTHCEVDLRVGGSYRFVHRAPDGSEFAFHGVYREIDPPRRLVSTFVYEGEPDAEIVNTLTLQESGGKTRVTIRSHHPSLATRNAMLESGMEHGMREGFERLEELMAFGALQAQPILEIVRDFAAPREVVFACWTQPEHFQQWWGPEGFTAPSCRIDPRTGGVMHVSMAWPDGREVWTRGVFREVVAPERLLAWTHFSDRDGNFVRPQHYGLVDDFPAYLLMLVTFEDRGGATRMTVRQSVPVEVAKRQGAFEGWKSSLNKLASHLERFQS